MSRLLLPFTIAWLSGWVYAAPTLGERAPLSRWVEPLTGIEFVSLPASCFTMGNPDALAPLVDAQLRLFGSELRPSADEAPTHQVCLAAFWIARHEVTAVQWEQIMGSPPPAGQGQEAAGGLSWQQAQAFVAALNQQGQLSGLIRLPTEAEWEYACRGANPGDQGQAAPTDVAWYRDSHPRPTTPQAVGQLADNSWGLHDMLGNVWEWVQDSYSADAYQTHPRHNPLQQTATDRRVIRGASFRSVVMELSCSNRSSYPAEQSLPQIGLRLVRSEQP